MAESRTIATQASAVRIGYGVLALAAPAGLLRAQGIKAEEIGPALRIFHRLFGVRDIVVGLFTLDARNDPARLRRAVDVNIVSDTGDLLVAALALRDEDGDRKLAIGGLGIALLGLASWARARREITGAA